MLKYGLFPADSGVRKGLAADCFCWLMLFQAHFLPVVVAGKIAVLGKICGKQLLSSLTG